MVQSIEHSEATGPDARSRSSLAGGQPKDITRAQQGHLDERWPPHPRGPGAAHVPPRRRLPVVRVLGRVSIYQKNVVLACCLSVLPKTLIKIGSVLLFWASIFQQVLSCLVNPDPATHPGKALGFVEDPGTPEKGSLKALTKQRESQGVPF